MCVCPDELETTKLLILNTILMSNHEVIKEVNAIKQDFKESKLDFNEVFDCLKTLSQFSLIDFSDLYNAFFSSNPSLYFK